MNNLNALINVHVIVVFTLTVIAAVYVYLNARYKQSQEYADKLCKEGLVDVYTVVHSGVYLYYHTRTKRYISTDGTLCARTYTQALKYYYRHMLHSRDFYVSKTYAILLLETINHHKSI